MSLGFAFVIVVITLEFKGTKDAINDEAGSSFALLTGLGLIERIDPIGRGLQEYSHQYVGGLEDRRAHQHLQLLHCQPGGRRSLEACD
jgi:hypothetical protein